MKIDLNYTHRSKWLYDGCTTIDEMLERLSDEISHLEDIRELGAKVEEVEPEDKGYTHLTATIEQGSVEHKELESLGFEPEVLE